LNPVERAEVEIGRVTRPHGVRGEIRVQLHWAESDTLEHVGSVRLSRDGKLLGEYRIASARPADKAALLRLEGVPDRDAAERLRGASVSVPRSELPPLEPGEYYLCDLFGAAVVGPDGIVVGEVTDVRVLPTTDVLVVKRPDGTVAEQVLADPWIAAVDVEARRIELSSLEGLL
jgi:16S rRNA processing protein RimM